MALVTTNGYRPLFFPVQVHSDYVAPLERRSSGTECPTSSSGYSSGGVHHDGRRPILYDSYDEPRGQVDGTELQHRALDITCALGSFIVAPNDGVIPETVRVSGQVMPGAGASPRGGNYVWLRDTNGITHYFAHMLAPATVAPGQSVRAGQILGLCGRTGNAEGGCAHLHYATTDARGQKFNPYSALLALYRADGWIRPKDFPWLWVGVGLVAASALGYGLWRWLK